MVLKEPATPLVPYPTGRRVYYYFKRSETLGVSGQYRPAHKIEVVAILKHPINVPASSPSDTVQWREVGRQTSTFDTPEQVAECIRLTGFVATDAVEDKSDDYPYFVDLRFFNDVIPRPKWMDETVK